MEGLSKGIRNTLRFVAGVYLLLNLCVATIPRCDNILTVLQQTLNKRSELSQAESCHDMGPSTAAHVGHDHICECSLVKFVFVTLPNFDPQRFIGFRIQTSTLIQFDNPLWNPAAQKGPEPPYPRWILV